MKITARSSLREVAFCVCTALDRIGVEAVLTGGGAATVYAPRAVQSFDLDFVLEVYSDEGKPGKVLEALGYRRRGQDYLHAASRFQLEFPPGPLAIGSERITSWNTMRRARGVLHVLSPTDSCRDRLAAFYFFRDRSALEQALAVARQQRSRIDLGAIRSWSEREGEVDRCAEFVSLLAR